MVRAAHTAMTSSVPDAARDLQRSLSKLGPHLASQKEIARKTAGILLVWSVDKRMSAKE